VLSARIGDICNPDAVGGVLSKAMVVDLDVPSTYESLGIMVQVKVLPGATMPEGLNVELVLEPSLVAK
jgi:hypothetical protein